MYQDDGPSSATSSRLQFFSMMALPPGSGSSYPWLKELKSEERGLYLIHLLLTCANHVAAGNLENAEVALGQISHLASPDGDTMQRISAYFTEALAHRIIKGWPGVDRALNATRLTLVSEEILVRKLFFEMFPFLKVAFLLTNQAIIEAMEGEKMIHVIDLHAAEPTQWIALLHSLRARQEGPPHLRITGIHPQKEILDQTAHKLIEEAEKLDVPFQFNSIASKLENLDLERLRVKSGEALAISSLLQLHPLLASENAMRSKSPSPSSSPSLSPLKKFNGAHLQKVVQMSHGAYSKLLVNDMINSVSPNQDVAASMDTFKMSGFLSALWSLSPKIMVVTERDANHNGSTVMERLLEALYSYAALFDCLESTVSRSSVERWKVEKMLFGEEIKNIIACEGVERRERHEKLEKWIQRLDFAGFGCATFSYYALMQANRLLQSYGCDGYRIEEGNGSVVICWQDRSLFSVSAWRCRK